ncbi:MAG TPA: AAA family ATPase [Streptosporangiaceae bacterium]|nr:AAA family ATPase [Streptosporangiaceae bacterium]
MPRTLTGELPLMSREAELAGILTRLTEPEPVAFVLAGEAGVGKTRLAAEAARSAAELGFATARAVASRSAAAIPFGRPAGWWNWWRRGSRASRPARSR